MGGISSHNGVLYGYKINFEDNVYEQWNKEEDRKEGVIGSTLIEDLFLHTTWPILAIEGGELYSEHGLRRSMFTFELDTSATEITLSKMAGHPEGELRFWITLNSCLGNEIAKPTEPSTTTTTTATTTTTTATTTT